MKPQRLQGPDDARRLMLAALAALTLHAGLIASLPAAWWVLPDRQPLRFRIVLLPPKPVASTPPLIPSAPPDQALESTRSPPAADEPTQPAPVEPKPAQPAASKLAPAAKQPAPVRTTAPARPPSLIKPVPPVEPKPARESVRNPLKPSSSVANKAPKPPAKPRETIRHPPSTTPPAVSAAPPMAEKTDNAEPSSASRQSAPRGKAATRTARDRLDSTALLGQIARLETETQQSARTDGERAKRVNPSDTSSQEGFYIGSWVRKVEQIGLMNFPDVARRLNLQAGPTLEVAIRANGSLQQVRIVRSSGNAELDQAAQRIVRLGAPYAPFPPQLRQRYDVLYISRPWRFESSGRLRMR